MKKILIILLLSICSPGFSEDLPNVRKYLTPTELQNFQNQLRTMNGVRSPTKYNRLRADTLWVICSNSEHMNRARRGEFAKGWRDQNRISAECWRVINLDVPPR